MSLNWERTTTPEHVAKRIIKMVPRPMFPDHVTPFFKEDFSADTLEFVNRPRELAVHSPNSVNARVSRVGFVGEISVGKTSIIDKFCYDLFLPDNDLTVGVSIKAEHFQIRNCSHKFQILDTAGQERYRSLCMAQYRNIAVAVAVFDLSRPETLTVAVHCAKQIYAVLQDEYVVPTFLVGAKLDLVDSSPDKYGSLSKRARREAKKLLAEYVEVSSKTGYGIVDLFQRIACVSFEQHLKKTGRSKWLDISLISLNKDAGPNKNQTKCLCN